MMESKTTLPTYYTHHSSSLQTQKKFILKKIHYLFIYYAAKASRHTYRDMTAKYYMQLITHVYQSAGKNLFQNSQEHKQISHFFYGKGRRTALSFQEFLKTLPLVSKVFSKSNSAEEDLKYLMKHLLVVHEDEVKKEIEQRFVQFDMSLKQETLQYVLKLSSQLLIVYKLYFSNQINNKFYSAQRSQFDIFQNLLLFYKEFQIYPKIISASQLYLIYDQIVNHQDQSLFEPVNQKVNLSHSNLQIKVQQHQVSLNFSNFLDILVRVAITNISRLREVQNPEFWITKQKDSVKALLEYMQVVRCRNKNSKFKNVRFSLVSVEWQGYNSIEALKEGYMMSKESVDKDFFSLFEQIRM